MSLGDEELGTFFVTYELIEVAESLSQRDLQVILMRRALLRGDRGG